MRTIAEIRDYLHEDLRWTLWRPGNSAGSAESSETLLQQLLYLLCYIEGREGEYAVALDTYLKGPLMVRGQFEFQGLPFRPFVNEVASVYAEVAFILGHFRPARLLTDGEMARLASEVKEPAFRGRDWAEPELHALFGPPSHEVVGGLTTVACYGCERVGVKWVHFDLARQVPGACELQWLPEPILRDVRDEVRNRMHLLPFGRRWVDAAPSPKRTDQDRP
ncbi:hypothetical protein [Aquisphaera giovannonii]|nr:hypothetical protein [Aquisphaera giovannonii]